MSPKFSPTSQMELWKQFWIPLISPSFTFKCHTSEVNHFLRNSRTRLGSEVRGTRWGEEDYFFELEGFAFFPTPRQEGPESWGWECSASCKGIQRSHCVWYFASQLASDSNIRSNRYFSFTSGKRHFFLNQGGKKKKTHTHSWKHWSLITLHPIVLKIGISLIVSDNPLRNRSRSIRNSDNISILYPQ